jgi:hypothetical protein
MKSASWVCTDGYTFCVKIFGWLIVASASQAVQPAPDASLAPQELLFEAAAKAAEAGEPALAIQLYARLIARFPESTFIEQARGAVQAQKERLAKP